MATHPITPQFDKIRALVADIEADVEKFDTGNKSAGTRVRKAMQEVKKAAQDVRKTVVLK